MTKNEASNRYDIATADYHKARKEYLQASSAFLAVPSATNYAKLNTAMLAYQEANYQVELAVEQYNNTED